MDQQNYIFELKNIFENKENILNINIKNLGIDKILDLLPLIKTDKYEFKKKSLYKYYSFLVDLVIQSTDTEKKNKINSLIIAILKINKGHVLLKKLENHINFTQELLMESSLNSDLATFIYIKSKVNKFTIENNLKWILLNSCTNNDDRVIKYILKYDKFEGDQYQDSFIDQLFFAVFSIKSDKFIIKKLKLLSNYFDFIPHYDNMLKHVKTYRMYKKLSKFYYKSKLSYDGTWNLANLIRVIFLENNDSIYIKYILDSLKYINEYCEVILKLFLINPSIYNFLYLKKYNLSTKILKSAYKNKNELDWFHQYFITDNLYYLENENYSYFRRPFFIKLFSSLSILNLLNIDKFLEVNLIDFPRFFLFILPFTKFLNLNSEFVIKMNLLTHNFRIFNKKFKKLKRLERKVIMNPLLYQIKNYKPKKNKIMKKGSLRYQLRNQKFNRNNSRDKKEVFNNFYLTNNYSGKDCYLLPFNIYPFKSELFQYNIKAKFVEEFNIYIVYDINIPNMTIEDRYLFLRKLHDGVGSEIKQVDNSNLFEEFNKEKNNIIKYNKKNKRIKWYPKTIYQYNGCIDRLYNKNLICGDFDSNQEFIL